MSTIKKTKRACAAGGAGVTLTKVFTCALLVCSAWGQTPQPGPLPAGQNAIGPPPQFPTGVTQQPAGTTPQPPAAQSQTGYPPPQSGNFSQQATPQIQSPGQGSALDQLRPNYVLRAGDQILIRAFEMDELNERPFRIDGDGFINLPVLGRIQAAGLSVEKLEAVLVEASRKYVRQPQVSVTVVQFSSDPVFFVGAFRSPGIYTLAGGRTLVEMIESVGGLQQTASRRIKVTRRKEYGAIPLPNAITEADGGGSSIEISMASLHDNLNPADDIVLKPFDVISVERAELIYVTGEVGRVAAFDLQERDSMSVMQVLTLAGGLTLNADKKGARILRPIVNSDRRAEIPLNIDRILKGQDTDKPLLPNDVLYVPTSSHLSKQNLILLLPLVSAAISLSVLLTR